MLQRQFRIDDAPFVWPERYGFFNAGDKVWNTNHTLDASDGCYYGTLTGNVGDKTGPTDLADGTYTLICKIHQSQGSGALDFPNWEYNVLLHITSGIATFKYPFTKTWNGGAQFVTANSYRSVATDTGVKISCQAYNGSKGGILFVLGGSRATIAFNVNGLGFAGGANNATSSINAFQGTSSAGVGTTSQAANGMGGGGGRANTSLDQPQSYGGGGGGGYANPGSDGIGTSGSQGSGGQTAGTADLRTAMIGAGGGGGGGLGGDVGGIGGNGAALVDILAKIITISESSFAKGDDGGNWLGGFRGCGAGGGTGGSVSLKGQIIKWFNNVFNIDGGTFGLGNTAHNGQNGGSGSIGRMAVDYGKLLIPGSGISFAGRQDSALNDSPGVQVIG